MRQTTVNFNLELNGRARPIRFDLILDPDQPLPARFAEEFQKNSFYKPETSRLLSGILRPGDTFIDIGTHVGYFSLLAASLMGPGGFAYAVEPKNKF